MGQLKRRSFIAGLISGLAACRRRAEGFPGYAFIANRSGRAVAVVDLGAFAAVRHIRLDGNPTMLISSAGAPYVYGLTPETGTVHEIDPGQLALARKVHCCNRGLAMKPDPGGRALWLLAAEPRALIRVPLDRFKPDAMIRLPESPADFDLSPWEPRAAVTFGKNGLVALVDLKNRQVESAVQIGRSAGVVRFRGDGKLLLIGNPGDKRLTCLDVATGGVVVHLPLSIEPENFCFKADGGQLFITGRGMDAVVTVYPYQTQIASTTLAGRGPGYMAASAEPDYLFVANPDAGDVTILDVATLRVMAVVTVGQHPCHIAITPDNEYALVLNRDSGDMAVIRIATLTGRRRKFAPLFMMVPVGSQPVSAVVRAI